jgi:hypothetical protein
MARLDRGRVGVAKTLGSETPSQVENGVLAASAGPWRPASETDLTMRC